MGGLAMRYIAAVMALLIYSSNGYCWGPLGHQIIGAVADERMSPEARAMVAGILGMETSWMAANWADENRSDVRFTHNDKERDRDKKEADDHNFSDFHYINLDSDQKYENRPNHDKKDSFGAIKGSIKILKDPSAKKVEKEIALKYLIHLIGDIHQPLHVGNLHDIGANFCLVYWKKSPKPKSLHQVWDTNMVMAVADALEETNEAEDKIQYVDQYIAAFKEKRKELFNAPKPKDVSIAAIQEWVNEIVVIRENKQKPARSFGVYYEKPGQMDKYYPKEYEHRNYCMWFEDARKGKWGKGSPQKKDDIPRENIPRLEEEYLTPNTKLAEKQLLDAGIRLAAILDDIALSSKNDSIDDNAQDVVIKSIQKTFQSFN